MGEPELKEDKMCYPLAFIKYNSDESRPFFCAVGADSGHGYGWKDSGTAAFYFWRKMTGGGSELLDRLLIKKILIKLRKRAYSTLR